MTDEPQLYLIAHKVRGRPAFDVAHKMQMGVGHWWIIPTSGHRAYPYWIRPLPEDLDDCGPLPADLPDHYPASAATAAKRASAITAPRPEDL